MKQKEKMPNDAPPFDFKFIRVLINKKEKSSKPEEVLIDREWVAKDNTIPHFSNEIKDVDPNEGVEITMNCNANAFHWIIEFVKIKSHGDELV